MTDLNTLLARLENLEERAAHQEQTIEDLGNVITDQWKQIETLKRDVGRLNDEMREMEASADHSGRKDPPPPHY